MCTALAGGALAVASLVRGRASARLRPVLREAAAVSDWALQWIVLSAISFAVIGLVVLLIRRM
jgi:hypothetical protein